MDPRGNPRDGQTPAARRQFPVGSASTRATVIGSVVDTDAGAGVLVAEAGLEPATQRL